MAANSLIAWQNLEKTGTFTAGSAATNLPITNLATDQGSSSQAWQTVYGVTTSANGATFTLTPTVPALTFDIIGLFRTNLTVAATITFTLKSAGISVFAYTGVGAATGYGLTGCFPQSVVSDTLQIDINDPGNRTVLTTCRSFSRDQPSARLALRLTPRPTGGTMLSLT